MALRHALAAPPGSQLENSTMNPDFHGKTAIVTGAAHGFGRTICLALAEQGAHVWALDVVADELALTALQCADQGQGSCQARSVDVTDAGAVQALVAEVCANHGHVDILVNNAGGVLGQVGRPLETVTPAEWNAILAVNLSGAFYLCQAVAPGMKAAKDGRIVNISSGAGLTVSLTGIQAYAAAKAGVISLTRQLCHELGEFGITVNCIAPGFIETDMTAALGDEQQKALLGQIPLGHLGKPADIAHAVAYLASPQAAYVTGQELHVNGGMFMV